MDHSGCSVDFGPLLGHKSGVVKEILFLGHKKAQIVLNHPVMETHLQVGERSNKNSWMAQNSAGTFLPLFRAGGRKMARCSLNLWRDRSDLRNIKHAPFSSVATSSGTCSARRCSCTCSSSRATRPTSSTCSTSATPTRRRCRLSRPASPTDTG